MHRFQHQSSKPAQRSSGLSPGTLSGSVKTTRRRCVDQDTGEVDAVSDDETAMEDLYWEQNGRRTSTVELFLCSPINVDRVGQGSPSLLRARGSPPFAVRACSALLLTNLHISTLQIHRHCRYYDTIRSFGNRETELVYQQRFSKRLPHDIQRRAPPANHLEQISTVNGAFVSASKPVTRMRW